MKNYTIEEIENILMIKGHNYPLSNAEIKAYFNYFVNTLNISNPQKFLSKKVCLGVGHGLYILMYGRDLKDILDNFQGTEKDKKTLLGRLSLMNEDTLLEVSVLGQLSRNGNKIKFYNHLDNKNPEATIEVNGKTYFIEVTRTAIINSNGENLIEKRGLKFLNELKIAEKLKSEELNGKTFIFSPKTSFSEFQLKMEEFKGPLNDFFINSDEVEIINEILTGDKVLGTSYTLEGYKYFCKFIIQSTFNHFLNKLSKKSRQYKNSAHNFILYLEIAEMGFMVIGQIVSELQHYLKNFSNCAAVVICERFAIDYQEKFPDLFSECYIIVSGNCKDAITPRTPDGEYNFNDIDKLILCQNTHFIITKDGDARLISKRIFTNKYN